MLATDPCLLNLLHLSKTCDECRAKTKRLTTSLCKKNNLLLFSQSYGGVRGGLDFSYLPSLLPTTQDFLRRKQKTTLTNNVTASAESKLATN